jgi:hypothetical protein
MGSRADGSSGGDDQLLHPNMLHDLGSEIARAENALFRQDSERAERWVSSPSSLQSRRAAEEMNHGHKPKCHQAPDAQHSRHADHDAICSQQQSEAVPADRNPEQDTAVDAVGQLSDEAPRPE